MSDGPSFTHFRDTLGTAVKCFASGTAGGVAALGAEATGINTFVHERLGHCSLGGGLMYNNLEFTYQVDAIDNLRAIGKSQSIGEAIKNVGRWLTGYDRNGDGAAGWASVGGEPNQLAETVGKDGRSAWISVTGSLPGLAVNVTGAVVGVEMLDRYPAIGCTILAFVLIQHLANSAYPIHAALMSSADLIKVAKDGHDFANLAVRLSRMTGIGVRTLAMTTAFVWTASVPTVMGLAFMRKRAHRDNRSPDRLALRHLAGQGAMQEEIQTLWNSYRRVNESESEDAVDVLDFETYAARRIDHNQLLQAKRELLTTWQGERPHPKVHQMLSLITLAGPLLGLTSQLTTLLHTTAFPKLALLSTTLQYASLGALFVGTGAAVWEAVDDLQRPNEKMPTTAKVCSATKALFVSLGSLAIVAGTFSQRLSLPYTIATLATVAIPITCDFGKEWSVRRAFNRDQQSHPSVDVYNTFQTTAA